MVKLKNLINEEETFKLKKKDGGNIVVFKNKDNYEKALKSGEYIDPINKGDDSLGGKDDEKGSTATASDFDIDKRLGKDKDSDDKPKDDKPKGERPATIHLDYDQADDDLDKMRYAGSLSDNPGLVANISDMVKLIQSGHATDDDIQRARDIVDTMDDMDLTNPDAGVDKMSMALQSSIDAHIKGGKDKDSDDRDPSYGKWDDMEDRMFSPDDFDTWLDDSGVKLSDEDKKEVDELMDNWYDLDGDLQQAEMEFEMGDDEDGDAEYQMDMIKDELDVTKADIRRIMMKYKDDAEKEKDSDDGMSMSSEEGIKNDLDQLRDKIKVRGDKQIRNGEVFRQLAQDVEDEYGEEAGIQSVEDLRYISYDIAEKGIENTEEMLKKVLDNLELELQRYNSDVFQSVPGRDPKESYRKIKEQYNRIKRK